MTSILIRPFDTEAEAKDYFAEIAESVTRHGAFITKSGKVFVHGISDPVIASPKWIVISCGAEVVADTP